MPPLTLFYLISMLAILPLAWFRGGHPERAGVALFLCIYIASALTQTWRDGDILWGPLVVEVTFLAGLIRLALKRDRWWPMAATAFQFLLVILLIGAALTSEITARSGIVAALVLGVLSLYCLLGGVLERILAGEPPVSATAIWTRVRRPPAAPML